MGSARRKSTPLWQPEQWHKGATKPPPSEPILSKSDTDNPMSSNPYVQLLMEQGYTEQECRTSSVHHRRTFPCTIGLRTFNTEEEYQEALHDFLNGY